MSKLLRQNVGGTDYSMAGCALTATCATAAATAAKVAELTDGDVLADGMSVAVQFTNGNTAASPLTLTIGGVTANICDSRGQNIGGSIWQAGNVVTFLYTFGKFLLLNCVVDEVTLNNMNSVSSNAVSRALTNYLPAISEQHTATRIDARFPSGSYNNCFWWRCGRVVTVKFFAQPVLSTYNHLDPCYSGLPKPIRNSTPQATLQWGGQPIQTVVIVDDNGNLCTDGNATGETDVAVYGDAGFTYITPDD